MDPLRFLASKPRLVGKKGVGGVGIGSEQPRREPANDPGGQKLGINKERGEGNHGDLHEHGKGHVP